MIIITGIVLFYADKKRKENTMPVNIVSIYDCITTSYFNRDIFSRCISITIENTYSCDSYFWIGREPKGDPSEKNLTYKYFMEHPSSSPMSLKEIIAKGHHCEQEIGYTFLKLLKPNATFTLVVPDDESNREFFTKRFIIVPAETVHGILGQRIPQNYLYSEDLIVLTNP